MSVRLFDELAENFDFTGTCNYGLRLDVQTKWLGAQFASALMLTHHCGVKKAIICLEKPASCEVGVIG